jgi:peptidyl-prolyl cis-trans isomerase C
MHIRVMTACFVVLVGGCKKGQSPAAGLATNAPDVLVEVDGQALTRTEAMKEVEIRLAAVRTRMQPDQLEQTRQQAIGYVAEQFIAKALLTKEADRRGIVVTADDEAAAMDKLKEKLPPGMTVEQAMKDSPAGPERMRQELVIAARMDKLVSSLVTNTTVTEEQYVAFTNMHQRRLAIPEAVHARHILIASRPGDPASDREAKRAKAESIRTNLLSGSDFATLARENSDCPSKERGGDLGTFGRGKMVKAFEEAAFRQEPNVIGYVIETQFGYHIIQTIERHPPTMPKREKILEIMAMQRKKEAFSRLIESLRRTATVRYGAGMPPPQAVQPAPQGPAVRPSP